MGRRALDPPPPRLVKSRSEELSLKFRNLFWRRPWSDLFIARGRALAAFGRGKPSEALIQQLKELRNEAEQVGFAIALPAIEKALESG